MRPEQRRRRREKVALPEDAVGEIMEYGGLDRFVFWPMSDPKRQYREAVNVALISKTWAKVSKEMETSIQGQPPSTLGVESRNIFENLLKSRKISHLELYTLGNHSEVTPINGRTRIDLDKLLGLKYLRSLKVSASGLYHGGKSVAELAEKIRNSKTLETCQFRLKTGDLKPKALIQGDHKDCGLDALMEAGLKNGLKASYLRENVTSLILTKRISNPLTDLKDSNGDLTPDLTLLVLHSSFKVEFSEVKMRFEKRISDKEIRKFRKLNFLEKITEIHFAPDETRAVKVLKGLDFPRLLVLTNVKIEDTVTPYCSKINRLSLNGDPRLSNIYSLRSCLINLTLHQTIVQACCWDFSEFGALGTLNMSACLGWVVDALPPNCSSIDLKGVELGRKAHLHSRFESLTLKNCRPTGGGEFQLPQWLSSTGVKFLYVSDSDHVRWSIGDDFQHLCATLRTSNILQLRLTARLASSDFASLTSSSSHSVESQHSVEEQQQQQTSSSSSSQQQQQISSLLAVGGPSGATVRINHPCSSPPLSRPPSRVFFDLYYAANSKKHH